MLLIFIFVVKRQKLVDIHWEIKVVYEEACLSKITVMKLFSTKSAWLVCWEFMKIISVMVEITKKVRRITKIILNINAICIVYYISVIKKILLRKSMFANIIQ